MSVTPKRGIALPVAAACAAVACAASPALAYEINTHADMTANATLRSSALGQQLPNLGLTSLTDTLRSGDDVLPVTDWMRRGATREDDTFTEAFARYRNHFFDPRPDAPNRGGFTGVTPFGILPGLPAPDWALEPTPIPSQNASFVDARTHFYDALTKSSKEDRESELALTFRTLGQVCHLVQDMGQPQHTRNDGHGFPPSLFESYTDGIRGTPLFQSSAQNGAIPQFNNARDFFINDEGTGLAQYTNRSFVTQGTNFGWDGAVAMPNATYAFPVPLPDAEVASVQDEDVPPAIKEYCGTSVQCNMRFYASVNDRGEIQRRAATLSIFADDLEQRNIAPPNIDGAVRFSFNTLNFRAVLPNLIPHAVSYSAGMIDYFFRGNIDYLPDPLNVGSFLIKNLGPEDMSGTFSLYYDAKDGTRKPVVNRQGANVVWQTSAPLAAKTGQMTVTPDFDPPADAKVLNEYMLVFKGTMGEEKPENGSIGAVAAKSVENPYNGALYLAGSTTTGQVQFFKLDKRGFAPLQPSEPNPLEGFLFSTLNPERPYYYKQAIVTTTPSGVQVHKTVAVAYQRGFGTNALDATLALDPVSGTLRLLTGINWIAQSPDPTIGTFQFVLRNRNLPGQQPFVSYTRRFQTPGGVSTTTGNFLLPAAPAGSSFYSQFSKGIMFVSPDGTEFYPRGPTGLHPLGLRITLGATPTAAFFDTPKPGPGSSTVTAPPDKTTSLGTCSVDYIDANHLPATATAPRGMIEHLNHVTGAGTGNIVLEDFLGGKLLKSHAEGTVEILDSSVSDACSVGATDFSDPSGSRSKFTIVYNVHAERIDTGTSDTIIDPIFPGGGGSLHFALNKVHVAPGPATVLTGCDPGAPVFSAGLIADVAYTYTGFSPCPDAIGSVFVEQEVFDPGNKTLYRALTDRADDAVYIDVNGTYKFRSHPLNGVQQGALFVGDASPLGEVFLAMPDLSLIVHEPKNGNMPVLTRDMLPSTIVKLLGAVWM